MKSKILVCPLLAILCAAMTIVTGCSKNNHAGSTIATSSPTTSTEDPKDLADASVLINGMVTNATMVQSLLSQKSGATTNIGDGNATVATGYDFNGMEFGKPSDLFCGANIGGGEDADNFLVNVAYDGPDCTGQFHLKGKVVIQVPRWVEGQLPKPGGFAYVYIDLNNIGVTRLADNKHMTFSGHIWLVYNDQYHDTFQIAKVADLKVRKNPDLYVSQSISTVPDDSLIIHYDDGSHLAWAMGWYRRYQYKNGQIVIYQQGSNLLYGEWSAALGSDRLHRPFYWANPRQLVMWENCGYKPADGVLSLHYGDGNPAHDSASIVFGVDKNGQPPSSAVQNGLQCQDLFFIHYSSYSQGKMTADMLFPE